MAEASAIRVYTTGFLILTGFLVAGCKPAANRPIESASAIAPKTKKQDSVSPGLPLVISRETTFFTTPVKSDGYVDYYAALRDRTFQGVTPENNAATDLARLFGPAPIESQYRASFYAGLGIQPLDEQGHYWVDTSAWIRRIAASRGIAQDLISKEFNDESYVASDRPWTRMELPILGQYIADHEEFLPVIAEATTKTRHVYPEFDRDHFGGPTAPGYPELTKLQRDVFRFLHYRTMERIGSGDWAEARKSLMLLHRWARMMSLDADGVRWITAYAVAKIAMGTTARYVLAAPYMPDEIVALKADIDALPPIASPAAAIDVWERTGWLILLTNEARRGSKPREGGDKPDDPLSAWSRDLLVIPADGRVEWNEVFRLLNQYTDALVAAVSEHDPRQRRARVKALRKQWEQIVGIPDALLATREMRAKVQEEKSPAKRAAILAAYYAQLVLSLGNNSQAFHPIENERSSLEIVMALAAYRHQNGTYPARLSDLVPAYCAALPKQTLVDADFGYRLEGDGFVLWSFGENDQSDNGDYRDISFESNPKLRSVPSARGP